MNEDRRGERPAIYYSYLLRLRRVDNAGRPAWRASLETPGSDTQRHFDSLADLCNYLADQLNHDETAGSDADDEI